MLSAPKRLEVGEISTPAMSDDRVLVKTIAGSVCGGDLKSFVGSLPSQESKFMGGHEYVGTVTDVGRNVTGFLPGDTVINLSKPYCGRCPPCREDHTSYCMNKPTDGLGLQGGGFAEAASFHAPDFGCSHVLVPDDIDPWDAVLAEPANCALGAVLRADVAPGDQVVILGLGGLGQLVAQLANASGGRTIGVDLAKPKLELASHWCETTLDASEGDLADIVMDATAGIGADVVFEVVGLSETFEQAFTLARPGGRVVLVGVHTDTITSFHPKWIFRRGVTAIGALGSHRLLDSTGQPRIFDLIRRRIVQPEPLMTRFVLEDAQEAFEAQLTGEVAKASFQTQQA
jgi:threonine dehydrogenase-like Zn-dependent dehydrogenase